MNWDIEPNEKRKIAIQRESKKEKEKRMKKLDEVEEEMEELRKKAGHLYFNENYFR